MGNLIQHAEKEMRIAGMLSGTDPLDEMMVTGLRAGITAIEQQHHSDSTRHVYLHLLARLANMLPLSPLTDAADEWQEVGPCVFQNKRCSTVFKTDGVAYDINGPIRVWPNGDRTEGARDRIMVSFPYLPPLERPEIMVGADGEELKS